MKPRVSHQKTAALTLVEVLVVIVVLSVLAALLLPALAAAQRKAKKWACVSSLEQVGLAVRVWSGNNGGKYPMQVSVTNGGTMELAATGDAASTFQVMSNELVTPQILWCPADKDHFLAKNWTSGFSARNISYFVGLDARTNLPQAFLSGDDNFTYKNAPIKSGLLNLSTNENHHFDWAQTRHGGCTGNLLFSDGSVQDSYSFRLQMEFQNTGLATNHLAIP